MGLASPESEVTGVAELDSSEQGQTAAPEVVKVVTKGAAIGVPPRFLAPVTVTV